MNLPYAYLKGPDVVRDLEAAKEGLNCIALIHLIYREVFKVLLPDDLKAIELYYPNQLFYNIGLEDKKNVGDVVFMARDGINKLLQTYVPEFDGNGNLLNGCPFHLGMYVGESPAKQALFIHANYVDKRVAIWSEPKVRTYVRYSSIFAFKRCKLLTE